MGALEALEQWAANQEDIDVGLRLDRPFTLDGTLDNIDSILDYDMAQTGTAQNFYVGPPPIDEDWHVRRLIVNAVNTDFNDATAYGTIAGGLPTGIHLDVVDGDDNILYHFTPIPIKLSYDWAIYTGIDADMTGGAGPDALKVRWTFKKAGYNIKLVGARGMRLRCRKADDLTALEQHILFIQGFRRLIPS